MIQINIEEIITELVVNGGSARSKALEAIRAAKNDKFEDSERLLKESDELIVKAHSFQTSHIQEEMCKKDDHGISLLEVHGQDHLMDAMVVNDLAKEIIELYRTVQSIREELK